MAWKCFGRRGFAERIENLFYLSQRFAKQLEQHPRFELGAPVASVNLCFRFVPAGPCSETEIGRLNLLARDVLATSGAALVNYAQLDGRPFWRLVLTNFDLDEAAMDRLFELIEAACVEAFDKGQAEVRDAS
jgi:glutamate/tyrosine decarboxylase-like PLP-dependent enzyme